MTLSYLNNLALLSVGISIAAIGILGFTVFFNNFRSATNRSFLFLTFAAILWSISNYLINQAAPPYLALGILRFNIFFAVWYSYALFQFFYVFPTEKVSFPRVYTFGLVPLVVLTTFLTLTPYVFSHVIEFFPDGRIAKIENGLGIALFGIVVLSLIGGGIIALIRKILYASDREKTQLRLVALGATITFSLHILFNFILPAFFNNPNFIPFGALFTFPFIGLTAYAIMKHGLLHLKVVTTSLFAFILNFVSFIEIIFASSLGEIILRISIFILIFIFSIFLIRSVRKEVEQREKIEEIALKLEKANVELEKLDKAKSEFLSTASHQLRTPLTAVKGYISMILEGSYGKVDEEAMKKLQNVYEANERLINLINDLLNLSRIESGKIEMKWEDVDVQEVSRSIIQELEIKAKEKNLQLKIIAEEPAIRMRADKAKLRNIIMNIVDNAIRYTEKGGITVTLKKLPTPAMRIEVSDTGVGMTQEELQHLFQRFSRGQAGTSMWAGGSGLGLNIAKEFTQLHKGKIWAESQGRGQGSIFVIELPLDPSTL